MEVLFFFLSMIITFLFQFTSVLNRWSGVFVTTIRDVITIIYGSKLGIHCISYERS